MDNVDFFVDVNELMNNLNVENQKKLTDDELNFHRFVELVLSDLKTEVFAVAS